MYQLYRLFDSVWVEWEKSFECVSRRQAIQYIRRRYNLREGTFKVRRSDAKEAN